MQQTQAGPEEEALMHTCSMNNEQANNKARNVFIRQVSNLEFISQFLDDYPSSKIPSKDEIWFENLINRIIAAFLLIGFTGPQCDSGSPADPGQHANIQSLSMPKYTPFWQVEDGCTQRKHGGTL